MGRGCALVGLTALFLSGCGGGGLGLRASAMKVPGVHRTATATPTALPRGPHSTMLICPYRDKLDRGDAASLTLR